MQVKEKLFDLGRIQTHYPRILITDGPNVLNRAMRNLSGFLHTQKFTLQRLFSDSPVASALHSTKFHYALIVVLLFYFTPSEFSCNNV